MYTLYVFGVKHH